MKKFDESRREVIGFLFVGSLVGAAYPVTHLLGGRIAAPHQSGRAFEPTAASSLGPFYKEGAPQRASLVEPGYSGKVLRVSGLVRDTTGRAVPGTTIEVFHADPAGEYDLDGYRYRARLQTDEHGAYGFETAPPGHYGGRAQHIHYVIHPPGGAALVTQLYFADDPVFAGDPSRNFGKDRLITDDDLIRPVERAGDGKAETASVVFEITLAQA